MFASPVRQALSVRRGLNPGLLVGAASVSALLALTPLVLPVFEDHFGVPVSLVGLVSSVEVGVFALASFLGGRYLHASNRLFRASLVALALANVAAAFSPSFSLLLATRLVGGLAAGIVNWLAWRQAARIPAQMGPVVVIGPATAAIASIVLGFLIGRFGFEAAYLALAATSLVGLALAIDIHPGPPTGRRPSPSQSNRVLLAALGCITLFGSAIFLFSAYYLGPDRGGPTWLLSWALAGNAAAGIIGGRFRMRSGGTWFIGTAACALLLGVVENVWVGLAAMLAWGTLFWFAVPAVLRLIEDFSNDPGERAGDAQAVMAAGRVAGPLLGGGLIAATSATVLGVVAASGLAVGGALVLAVERYRRTALPPSARSAG